MKYLHRYGARLFGHPTCRDDDGRITAIVERTNNVAEHFFARQEAADRVNRAAREGIRSRPGGSANRVVTR
ncbi:hypothetical protein [Vreelandella aquamarina]|uniref:hypothetical protein n=1 Tax=Vreelandella aquamarina TaxID=77097 RepID=UPI000ACCC2F8|nr:hypothetical protein [Halomonas axialensis]